MHTHVYLHSYAGMHMWLTVLFCGFSLPPHMASTLASHCLHSQVIIRLWLLLSQCELVEYPGSDVWKQL